MTVIRQMTQKGDPILRTHLTGNLLQQLKAAAKQHKRRLQDEFIKRLAATFQHDDIFTEPAQVEPISAPIPHYDLTAYGQMISREMLIALKTSADAKNVSLDIEVNLRLNISFTKPEAVGLSSFFDAILNCNFTYAQAVAECNHSRQRWVFLYEMEKLKLYLQFSDKLPKDFKEKFMLIDVKEATKKIQAELAAEAKASAQEE